MKPNKKTTKENNDKQNKLSFAKTIKKYETDKCTATSSFNNAMRKNSKNLIHPSNNPI